MSLEKIMDGHLNLILEAATKVNPSTPASKSLDVSQQCSSATDSESVLASEQDSSDGEFDADEVSCGEDAEQACVRSAKRRPMMIRDFLEGSTPKRSKAMESHNENERKRRKSLKLSVLNLREQMNRKTRKPSTISILRAAQEEIQELRSREEQEEKILDELRKKNDVLTYLLHKQIDKAKKAQALSDAPLPEVASSQEETTAKDDGPCSEAAGTPVVGSVSTPVVRPMPTSVPTAPQISSESRLPMSSLWMTGPAVSTPCSPLSVPLVPFLPTTHPNSFLAHANATYPHSYYNYYNPSISSFLPRHPLHGLSTALPARFLLPVSPVLSAGVPTPVSLATHNWIPGSHPPRVTENEDSFQEVGTTTQLPRSSPVSLVALNKSSHAGKVPQGLASLETESADARLGKGSSHLQDTVTASGSMAQSPSSLLPGVHSRKRKESSSANRESKVQGYSELAKSYQAMQPQPFLSPSSSSPPAMNGYFSPKVNNFASNSFSSRPQRLKIASNSNAHTPMYYQIPPHTMWHCQLTAAKAQ